MRLPARPFPSALLAASTLLGAMAAGAATWSPLQPASHPRSEGTFVVHDGGAFHFNGFDARLRIQNSIERYDIAGDRWQTVAETTDSAGFPTALTHSGVVAVDAETWLIGGRIGANPGKVTDRVFVFDLDTYAWREGPTLPVPFAGGGAALVGRRIHVFGGVDAQARCGVDTHLVHDLDAPGSGWQDLSDAAPFPSPRNHFGTVVLDGLVYVMGGQIGHDDCAKLARQRVQTPLVHVYDPTRNDWTRLADMPWPQSHAEPSSFAHAGRIWSVGGQVQGQRVLSYDPGSDEWTWRKDLELPSALLAPGARIFHGNRLHLFGGGAPDVFNPRTETWVTDVPRLASDGSGGPATPEPQPEPEPEPTPTPAPQPDPLPDPAPEPQPEPTPGPQPMPDPQPNPEQPLEPPPVPSDDGDDSADNDSGTSAAAGGADLQGPADDSSNADGDTEDTRSGGGAMGWLLVLLAAVAGEKGRRTRRG